MFNLHGWQTPTPMDLPSSAGRDLALRTKAGIMDIKRRTNKDREVLLMQLAMGWLGLLKEVKENSDSEISVQRRGQRVHLYYDVKWLR